MIELLLAQNTRLVSDRGKESAPSEVAPKGDGASLNAFGELITTLEEQGKQALGPITTPADAGGRSQAFNEISVGELSQNGSSDEPRTKQLAINTSELPVTDRNPLSKTLSDLSLVPQNKALSQEAQIDSRVQLATTAMQKASLMITDPVVARGGDAVPKAQTAVGELQPASSSLSATKASRTEKNTGIFPKLEQVSLPGQPVPDLRPAAFTSLGNAGVDGTAVRTNSAELIRRIPSPKSGPWIPLNTPPTNSANAVSVAPAPPIAEVGSAGLQNDVKEGDSVLSENALLGRAKLDRPEPGTPLISKRSLLDQVGSKKDDSLLSHSNVGQKLTKSGPLIVPSTEESRLEIRKPSPASVQSADAQQNRDSSISETETSQAKAIKNFHVAPIAVPSEMAAKPQRFTDQFDIDRSVSSRDLESVRADDADVLSKSPTPSTDESGSKPDAKVTPTLMIMGDQRVEPLLQTVSTLRAEGGDAPIRTLAQSADFSPSRQDFARTVLPQVSEAIRATSPGSVEIKLNPEELGRVKLVLTQQDAGMLVAFSADRAETMELIRRHVDLLAQELRQSGHQSVDFQFEGEGRRQESRESSLTFEDGKHATPGAAELSISQPTIKVEPDGRLDIRI